MCAYIFLLKVYIFSVSIKFAISFCESQHKQQPTKKCLLPILSNKSPQFHFIEKRIPQSYFLFFPKKGYLDFFLIAFVVELIAYLLNYLYFALTSIENQQYLNFKKQAEKRSYRSQNHIFLFKLRGLIAQDINPNI